MSNNRTGLIRFVENNPRVTTDEYYEMLKASMSPFKPKDDIENLLPKQPKKILVDVDSLNSKVLTLESSMNVLSKKLEEVIVMNEYLKEMLNEMAKD